MPVRRKGTDSPTKEGWLYLGATLDLCSRKVVGFCLAESLHTSLVTGALERALARAGGLAPRLHHSDRGCQYTSEPFRELLLREGILASMSAKGNCYDNATVESFWATLKTEAFPAGGVFETKAQACREIFRYIETFYNRVRLHSSLGYQSPLDFEKTFAYNLPA